MLGCSRLRVGLAQGVAGGTERRHLEVVLRAHSHTSMLRMNLRSHSWTTRLLLLVVEADSAVVAEVLVVPLMLVAERPEEEGAVQLDGEDCRKGPWRAEDEVGEIGKRFDL